MGSALTAELRASGDDPDALFASFADGGANVILATPTGSGKSLVRSSGRTAN